jgi:hypothetical protein
MLEPPVGAVPDLDPVAPAWSVAAVETLGDDALEAAVERPAVEVLAVEGAGRRAPMRAVKRERGQISRRFS